MKFPIRLKRRPLPAPPPSEDTAETARPALSALDREGLPVFDLGLLSPSERDTNEAVIRRLCHAVRLDDAVLCRVLGRYKMFVDPTDIGIAPHLMLDGIWEMQVTEAILRYIRAGMTAVDIGANQGYYTMLLADLVTAQGRVWAIEPNPRMMSLLRRSASVNGYDRRISMVELPVADCVDQPVMLNIPVGLPQNAFIARNCDARAGGIQLRTTTLDELIGDGPIDFIKIDVEGAEEAVWAGMERILVRQSPLTIFLEYSPIRYPDPEGFLQRMVNANFSLAMVHDYDGVQDATIPQILDGPAAHDRILVLTR